MAATFGDQLSRLGYEKARRLLVLVGLVVLALLALVLNARSVDPIEVYATLLFIPIFIGLIFGKLPGGVISAVGASVAYAALRAPDLEAIEGGDFVGLIASRVVAYLMFGIVGGWAAKTLESSLDKLDLYDQIDDSTGLYNARFF